MMGQATRTCLIVAALVVCAGHLAAEAAPVTPGTAPDVQQRNATPGADPVTRRLQRGPRSYVIFTDADEDDTAAITALAIQQALYADVTIAAIVVEDGFLSIDQGVRWLSYWMGTFFPQLAVPIVRGYPRGAYLASTRYFPAAWVSEYTGLLDKYYPAWTTFAVPTPKTPEELAAALLAPPKSKGRFSVLSIGPTTTLPIMFESNPGLLERTEYVLFDLGSIAPHNIYPGVPSANTTVDSTWNAFMNPDGLAAAVSYLGPKKRRPQQSLILTTEAATEVSLVTPVTVAGMQAVGAAYLNSNPLPGAAAYYNVTMSFIVNIVLGLGQLEGSPVALWDAVTALALVGVPIGQELKANLPLVVSWTGDTVFEGQVAAASRDVAQVYDKIDATLFFKQLIALVFKPLDSLF